MATRRTTGPTRTAESPQPPAEKSTARRRATPTTAAPGPGAPGASARISVSEEARRAMVAQAAYLRAERRGFSPGNEEEDWLAAEAEVDALLRAGNGRPPQ